LDVSRILAVGIARVVVISSTDLSTEVILNAQVEKQVSDYLGRRMLRQLQVQGSSGSGSNSGSGSGSTATTKKQLYPGISIEIGVGLGRNPDSEAVKVILNATAKSLKTAMEAQGSQFLPLFAASLLTETTTIVSPVTYSISADLSTLRYVSPFIAPVKGIDIIAIIAGSSSAGSAIAIFLTLTALRAYYAYRVKQQIKLRTIKPVMMDNPLRGGRGRLNKDAKTKIFLPVPEHALEIQNKKLMDIRFREQQHLIEEERKHLEEEKKAPEIERRKAAEAKELAEQARKVREAARAHLDLEQEKIRLKLEDEAKRSLDEQDKILQNILTREREIERLIKNFRAGAYHHAWVKISQINKDGEDDIYYIPFGDRLTDVHTRPREWALEKGQFEVADPKVPLDSYEERNCYVRKEERILLSDGVSKRHGKVWYEHTQTGARKERLPFGGIIKECEVVEVSS
jgi:hypothetical protein